MKLKFKHQKFQAEAAKAVVDVFRGQPHLTSSYLIDQGQAQRQKTLYDEEFFTGWCNQPILPEISDKIILDNLRGVQRENGLKPSERLEGKYNLTIEMETGVGKTYTYIKTMYELYKRYGWSKYIVVVPSIAIREGVYKSFQVTQDHFAEEYGAKIRFFIYDSSRLSAIDQFASDNGINVMIINSQAFNATGKDARRIYAELDEFKSRRPIDVIAKTNPIVIIDEPQSVEGKKTKENLKHFNALMTLRYSATHRKDSIYNMVYRLDAMEAYNKKLVKKIQVKGISQSGSGVSDGFVYLEGINLSKAAPTATVQFDVKGKAGIRKVVRRVSEGDNLYALSGELEEYKNGYTVSRIDGRDDSIEFVNGIKIYAGDVVGNVNEDIFRRIQIRETILSHIERERELFYKGIKVLSLFFIDEVAKYKQYDENGNPFNGIYADIFEEEYQNIINHLQTRFGEDEYLQYLDAISADSTHAGYFSIDKKGKMIDGKIKKSAGNISEDVDAYDLIMKNKELLLDTNPRKSPVRFIFSHSALREGWDNPNVFQICTLKQSGSEVRKRQEVGRGLRLCVNQNGERMDQTVLGADIHNVNKLTVIASESYEQFAKGLQTELAEVISDRPRIVDSALFVNKMFVDKDGLKVLVDESLAQKINFALVKNGYVDENGRLTEKYYDDKSEGEIALSETTKEYMDSIIKVLDSVYDESALLPSDARQSNVELNIDETKLYSQEFQALWKKINKKSYYTVSFDTEELVKKAIQALNLRLRVSVNRYNVEEGGLDKIESREALQNGNAFTKESADSSYEVTASDIKNSTKYDLVGKIVEETGLTRKAVVRILQGIEKGTFDQFKLNPEEFIIRASRLINEEKATAIIQHITYNLLDEEYDTTVFTEPSIKGKLNVNAVKTKKHLYDHVVYDSDNERKFAENLDISSDVAVYVKLPSGFYISTPVGKYNPDWAIAFYEGTVKHIYFIAETKGSMETLQLREIERSKIHCAKEHFKTISNEEVQYDVVDSYKSLLELISR